MPNVDEGEIDSWDSTMFTLNPFGPKHVLQVADYFKLRDIEITPCKSAKINDHGVLVVASKLHAYLTPYSQNTLATRPQITKTVL